MALAGAGSASAAPTPAASASPSSPQAIYDQGQAAYDRGDWAEAARDFVQLLPAEPAKVQGRSSGTIAYRYADALVRLGRAPEAKPWIDAATSSLASAEPGLAAEAWMVRADVDSAAFDYPAAFQDYLRADALLTPAGFSLPLVQARIGAGLVGSTIDPAHALKLLTDLMAYPDYAKLVQLKAQSSIEDVAARAALNQGDLKLAARLADQAVEHSGGLTESVTLPQVVTRFDAATIARLAGHDEEARQYLLYTGAGRLDNMSWINQWQGELPVCGEPFGADNQVVDLKDSVVIAFAIDSRGVVKVATPVYASRPGGLSQAFVSQVSNWRWDPADLVKVNPFWRSTLQLELRCRRRPKLADFKEDSRKAVLEELKAKGLVTPIEYDFASRGGALDIKANDPRLKEPNGVLLAIAAYQANSDRDVDRQWAALDGIKADPTAYAAAVEVLARTPCPGWCSDRISSRRQAEILARWAPRFQQRFPGDPAGDRLLMEESLDWEGAGDFKAAQPLLISLTTMPASSGPQLSTLRDLAYLHRAIGLEKTGDSAEAKAMMQRSGLNSETCALFNTHPIVKDLSSKLFYYPDEALHWNINGQVETDFDILANGHVAGARAIVSYPPFIFDGASTDGIAKATFIAPHIGDQALGCEGAMQNISYSTPH